MIIDKRLQKIYATGYDAIAMRECKEKQWIRFIDLNSAVSTISDFRNDKDLKNFLPLYTISNFIRKCHIGRLKELRIHRMNLLRHSIPSYKKQWDILGNIYRSDKHQGYYSEHFSNNFLKTHNKMKLVAVKIILYV